MSENVLEQALESFAVPLDDTAVYVRWSTADQGDGTTLETQLEACRKLCAHSGWTITEDRIFIDAGESGGNLVRPALDRLRSAVRQGAVKRVIVYRLDRLTRDTPDFNRLVRDEWEDAKRCQVISTVEGLIDVDNPTTLLSANIFVGFAEYERLVIRPGLIRASRSGLPKDRTPALAFRHTDIGTAPRRAPSSSWRRKRGSCGESFRST